MQAAAVLAALLMGGGWAVAAEPRQVTIPQDVVIHVTLDEPISSETARIGQSVTATMAPTDLSGFPLGTRFEGILTEVRRPTKSQPGMLAMRFHAVALPDPEVLSADGRLISLAPEETWRMPRGRRFARRDRDDDEAFDWRWVGYGAGAGALLATLIDGSFLRGALFGGLGGALYAAIRADLFGAAPQPEGVALAALDPAGERPVGFTEVVLAQGTPFGLRLMRPVTFTMKETFRFPNREQVLEDERVLGARQELFNGASVRVNGQPVPFGAARPVNLNGILYVPLEPVAPALRLGQIEATGGDVFQMQTPLGPTQLMAGRQTMLVRNQAVPLAAPPVTLNGELYVPASFLAQISGGMAVWNPQQLTLDVTLPRR